MPLDENCRKNIIFTFIFQKFDKWKGTLHRKVLDSIQIPHRHKQNKNLLFFIPQRRHSSRKCGGCSLMPLILNSWSRLIKKRSLKQLKTIRLFSTRNRKQLQICTDPYRHFRVALKVSYSFTNVKSNDLRSLNLICSNYATH